MIELTNNLRRIVASLDKAKERREHGLFKAEGTKCVADTLEAFELEHLIATRQWADENPELARRIDCICSSRDLERMSSLVTPQGVIAVYWLPQAPENILIDNEPALALDCIRDPGNMGTILRVADWFGIHRIIAEPGTVDCFSPKVVQASMGAISRVKVTYTSLPEFLSNCGRQVIGTFLDGENIYRSQMDADAVIAVGNEGNGISPRVEAAVSRRVTIPSYPPGEPTSESLNAAVATSITLALLRKNQLS